MHSIKKDKRYTQTLENCGVPNAQYVARFCGEWISAHSTKALAIAACQFAYDRRMASFTWVSGKWHLWQASTDARIMLSDEDTKCLRDFATIDQGIVPATVANFGDLNDWVDANEYGGFCDDGIADALILKFGGRDPHYGMPEAMLEFMNSCQDAIDNWLREDMPS